MERWSNKSRSWHARARLHLAIWQCACWHQGTVLRTRDGPYLATGSQAVGPCYHAWIRLLPAIHVPTRRTNQCNTSYLVCEQTHPHTHCIRRDCRWVACMSHDGVASMPTAVCASGFYCVLHAGPLDRSPTGRLQRAVLRTRLRRYTGVG